MIFRQIGLAAASVMTWNAQLSNAQVAGGFEVVAPDSLASSMSEWT